MAQSYISHTIPSLISKTPRASPCLPSALLVQAAQDRLLLQNASPAAAPAASGGGDAAAVGDADGGPPGSCSNDLIKRVNWGVATSAYQVSAMGGPKPRLVLASATVYACRECSSNICLLLLHFMICHSKKCHRPRTSSCHKVQRGGTSAYQVSACHECCRVILWGTRWSSQSRPISLIIRHKWSVCARLVNQSINQNARPAMPMAKQT